MVSRKEITLPERSCQAEEHWAGLLPGPRHTSFNNLCNGRANDGKAASTSESGNLDTAHTVANAAIPKR